MKLSEIEKKILILAMDHKAADGEYSNAAVKFVNLLRKRFKDGHELVKDLETLPEREPSAGNKYGEFIFPFGKHKGKALKDIPISYMTWCLTEIPDLWPATKMAIERVIYQGKEQGPF